jgi:hypothetical protein
VGDTGTAVSAGADAGGTAAGNVGAGGPEAAGGDEGGADTGGAAVGTAGTAAGDGVPGRGSNFLLWSATSTSSTGGARISPFQAGASAVWPSFVFLHPTTTEYSPGGSCCLHARSMNE